MDIKIALPPTWFLISFLTRLFGSGGGGSGEVPDYESKCSNDNNIIQELVFNPKHGYSKHRIPGGRGVQVRVEMWVQEVTKVSEITQDFEIGMSPGTKES